MWLKKTKLRSFVKKTFLKTYCTNTTRDLAREATIISEGLSNIYQTKIKDIEVSSNFDKMSPLLTQSSFSSKPMVLLLGNYSVGKSTFIQYLLRQDYPDINIAPQVFLSLSNFLIIYFYSLKKPSTDKFIAITHSDREETSPGPVVVNQPDQPFHPLKSFGASFLSRFQASHLNNPLLNYITIVDTPGFLAGTSMDTNKRPYDFQGVCKWFIERSDMVLLLFDAYKLDISNELESVIRSLKGHENKTHVLLNKADTVKETELLKIYGGLLWNLGKAIGSNEVLNVFLGSFREEKQNVLFSPLFQQHEENLLSRINSLPLNASKNRMSEFCKRMMNLKTHVTLIHHLKSQLPWMFKENKQKEIIANMHQHFHHIASEHNIALTDLPSVELYQKFFLENPISSFNIKSNAIQKIDEVISKDLQELEVKLVGMENIQGEKFAKVKRGATADFSKLNTYFPQSEKRTK